MALPERAGVVQADLHGERDPRLINDQEGRFFVDEPGRQLPGLLANGITITLRQNRVSTPRELVAIAETHASTSPPGTK